MKIIVAGAGDVGFHLAKLLAYEKHDIVVIDLDEEKLKFISSNLDVATIKGNSTSYEVLEDANVKRADLFIAVTSYEDTNITSAIFAKHLGCRSHLCTRKKPKPPQTAGAQAFKRFGH
jgi:trk system potassium uptake protein TrkA